MTTSTHLPPPVMIESAAVLALVTHMLCWSCAMCFSAAVSSENDHGSMNLASNTAPLPAIMPSRVAHPLDHRVPQPVLNAFDGLPRIALVPEPIEVLGHEPELDD